MIIHWTGSAAKEIVEAHVHIWDKSISHKYIEADELQQYADKVQHLILVVDGKSSRTEVLTLEDILVTFSDSITIDRYFSSEEALSAPRENISNLLRFGYRPFHQKCILDLYLKGNHLSFSIEQKNNSVQPSFPELFCSCLELSLNYFHNEVTLSDFKSYLREVRSTSFKSLLLNKQIFPEDQDILSLSCYSGAHRVEIIAPYHVIHENNQLLSITLNQLGADKTAHTSSLAHLSKRDIINVFDVKTCRLLFFSIRDSRTAKEQSFVVLYENR